MSGVSAYYQILGVTEKASLEELKRAYRKKALLLHPDRNPSPHAHDEFIFLTEAYEFLSKLKTGNRQYTPPTSPYSTPTQRARQRAQAAQNQYDDWQAQQRAATRRRAAEYAKMQYEEFINSDYYKKFDSFHTAFTQFYIAFGLVLIIGIPLAFIIATGWSGLVVAVLIMAFLWGAGHQFFREILKEVSFKELITSFRKLLFSKNFIGICLIILNISIIITIGRRTLINHWLLICSYIFTILLTRFIILLKATSFGLWKRLFYSICVAPLFISLLLSINFVFSSHPVQETYRLWNQDGLIPNSYDQEKCIVLEGNHYSQYPEIRSFTNYDQVLGKTHITYTFKEGLFGFRVMTHYEFNDE